MHEITLTLAYFEQIFGVAIIASLLIFLRLGTVLMIIPGIGEMYVLMRTRLFLALFTSFIIASTITNVELVVPKHFSDLVVLIFGEIIIGVFIGIIARILISATHIAGMLIAYESGLASASMFDANQGGQSSVFGNFLGIMALLFIMHTDLHKIYFEGVFDSYKMMPFGQLPSMLDLSEVIKTTVNNTFITAFKIASPYVAVGIVLSLGGGILSRLMPSLPVFFVLMPIQISLAVMMFLFTFIASLTWFMTEYAKSFSELFIQS